MKIRAGNLYQIKNPLHSISLRSSPRDGNGVKTTRHIKSHEACLLLQILPGTAEDTKQYRHSVVYYQFQTPEAIGWMTCWTTDKTESCYHFGMYFKEVKNDD